MDMQPQPGTIPVIVQPPQKSNTGLILLIVFGVLGLMVVGTIVLSGLLYVWASSLAA